MLKGYGITRDVRGNPTQVDTTTQTGTTSALYTYDAVSRLRTECYPVTGTACVAKSPRNAYTYDLVGNRTSQTSRTVSGNHATTVVTDYAYDAAYELLTESVAGAPKVTNTWTPNGALATSTTPAGTQTYTTDLTDELISLTLADGSTVGYTHDAQGNRTSRTVDGLVDATWAWDDLSSLPMRTGEYDASGTLATAWLADPTSSTGASLAQTSGGVSSWLLSDPFANTVASVSTTGGTVSGTRTMDAFGVERTSATGSLADAAVGFAGQYLDDATGLYDMRARDYDPSSGRFNATDPVAIPTGMPYVAGYSYAFNNPLRFTDASGLSACDHMFGLCDSPKFFWNELVGAKNGGVEMFTALIHPMDTYHGIIDSCDAGFADWNDGAPSWEGFAQCIDNINPIASIRKDFAASLNATCIEDSGQDFGHGLATTTAVLAPVSEGIGLPVKSAEVAATTESAASPATTGAGATTSTAARFVATSSGIIDTAAPALAAQIRQVVDALKATQRPPAGVRQGGLPGRPGVYANRSGALPSKPLGYYTESDVWPGTGPRGPERIVVGKNGDVWYSPDHYGTFRSWP